MPRPPKILFASPCTPNPKATVSGDGIDFFYYRNTIGQGVFQLRQMQSWHPLHFLAQNLPVESVVLENPTIRAFQREIQKGGYDVVALSFTALAAARVLDMTSWLRRQAPSPEVILGGYGTSIFSGNSPVAERLKDAVHHICLGEGLSFMRSYLRDRWGIEPGESLRQELVPTRVSLYRTRFPISRQLCFVHALGCCYRCVFCATSAQFGHRKVMITSPWQLYTLIKDAARKHPRIDNAIIYDEDFLSDRRRVLEFLSYIDQDDDLRGHPLLFTVFSSVRSISQYSLSELLRLRIGVLFVGVESFREEILEEGTPQKREGIDVAEIFRNLHSVGIHTLGSMIIGWDAQAPENITTEAESFVKLSPTFYQVMPLQAPPGSPLWKRMKDEGRLLDTGEYEGVGVTSPTFRHLHFTHQEVESTIGRIHRRLVREGGPSVFRMFEDLVHGICTLRGLVGAEYRSREVIYEQRVPRLFLLAFMSRVMFRGTGFKRRWNAIMKESFSASPVRASVLAACSMLLLPIVVTYSVGGIIRHSLSRHGEQPEILRRAYHGPLSNDQRGVAVSAPPDIAISERGGVDLGARALACE